jgi:ribosomal protein S28E/S33
VPLAVTPDEGRRWVVVRATGVVTLGEILHLMQTARADLRYRMWPMFVDARGARTNAVDADVEAAVATVRHVVAREGARGYVALVADDESFFARMLLYEARCAQIGVRGIRTFRQAADAEKWLAIMSDGRYL